MTLFTLQDVNFKNIIRYPNIEIKAHITTFISGESGSGKSTLLRLFNGLICPSEGKIFYQGKDISTYDPIHIRREVLLISQTVYLFSESIRDNFHRFREYRLLEPIQDEQIKQYLEICSLHLDLDSPCDVLSGGEKQRVFIAINLSLGSQVLMLDEPTSALDDKNAKSLLKSLKDYSKEHNMTLLVVSHDSQIVAEYADEIIHLNNSADKTKME